jgi:hypothetical protein
VQSSTTKNILVVVSDSLTISNLDQIIKELEAAGTDNSVYALAGFPSIVSSGRILAELDSTTAAPTPNLIATASTSKIG